MTRLRRRLERNAEDPILALLLLALGALVGLAVGLVVGFALARFGWVPLAIALALLLTAVAGLIRAVRP